MYEQDLENNRFLLDGSPFTPMSGEMHYFRVPRPAWEDRLTKIKEANLNCVTTVVEWGLHEPNPGMYDFKNELDLKAFINMAAAQQLLVILKVGPQTSSDRDFGGLPHWLLSVNPNMKCRTQDESFTYFFGRWLRNLYGQIQDLLAGKGGPIIMIQIEDAYGSNPVHDKNYLFWLRDVNRSLVGKNAILFTSDFPKKGCVERGRIPGVLATLKFGACREVQKRWKNLRDAYTRALRCQTERGACKPYIYENQMNFLISGSASQNSPVLIKQEPEENLVICEPDVNTSHLDDSQDFDDRHHPSASDSEMNPKRRRVRDHDQDQDYNLYLVDTNSHEQTDDDTMFLMSLAPSLRQIPPSAKLDARIKILEALKSFVPYHKDREMK